MFFTVTLSIALAICGIGLLYKMSCWLRYKFGPCVEKITFADRFYGVIREIVEATYDGGIFIMLRAFVTDVLLQVKILRQGLPRWVMHLCLFYGFILLVLMHALEKYISEPLFTDYYATLNPFMFLRDLFGMMVLTGLIIAVWRRFFNKSPYVSTHSQDIYALVILALIIGSGVLLEGVKITSYTRYEEMVEDYAGSDDQEDLAALEAYWAANFSVISPNVKAPFDPDLLEMGVHGLRCGSNHASGRP